MRPRRQALRAGQPSRARVRRNLPVAGVPRRSAVAVVFAALLVGVSACSAGTAGHGGQAGSCVAAITIGGVTYIAGRGIEDSGAVPRTGTVLHGTTPPCNDTPGYGPTEPAQPATAFTIPGVPVADAVAGPGRYAVMVAERLWPQPWAALPVELQPYVRR